MSRLDAWLLRIVRGDQ